MSGNSHMQKSKLLFRSTSCCVLTWFPIPRQSWQASSQTKVVQNLSCSSWQNYNETQWCRALLQWISKECRLLISAVCGQVQEGVPGTVPLLSSVLLLREALTQDQNSHVRWVCCFHSLARQSGRWTVMHLNRPFLSYFEPCYKSEIWCVSFLTKISSKSPANKASFHRKTFQEVIICQEGWSESREDLLPKPFNIVE